MKKCLIAVFLTIALSAMLTCAFASSDDPASWQCWLFFNIRLTERTDTVSKTGAEKPMEAPAEKAFRLPASLQMIGDEAFEGTAIVSVELPETVETIGERAFAAIPTLHSVKIPDNTREIAETAFAGSNNITLTGTPGSYAKAWARENGVPFAPVAVMCAGTGILQNSAGLEDSYNPIGLETTGSAERMQQHPQWRPFDETQSECRDVWFINQISGRAPPACA